MSNDPHRADTVVVCPQCNGEPFKLEGDKLRFCFICNRTGYITIPGDIAEVTE